MEETQGDLSDDVPVGEEINSSDINYDRTLPGLHRYLGEGFVTVGGRTYIEPGVETHMYAFFSSGVILVPGYSLPLISSGPIESDLLKRVNNEKRPLIFLPGCSDTEDFVGCVGTTADLIAICVPDSEEVAPIRAIFVGRQRIRITKVRRNASYPLICHGIILPEASVNREMSTNPLGWGLVPRSWSRFSSDPIIKRSCTRKQSQVTPSKNIVYSFLGCFYGSTRQSQKSNSSPSPQPFRSIVRSLPGNPLSIFNSALSSWNHLGLNSKDSPIQSSCSPTISGSESGNGLISPHLKTQSESPNDVEVLEEEHRSKKRQHTSIIKHEFKKGKLSSLSENVELLTMDEEESYLDRRHRLLPRKDILAATAHAFATLPYWVYHQYDLNYLVSAIQSELCNWNDTWQVDKWNADLAVPFSYWLIQNLPISGQLKSNLLGIDHVVQRLRALLDVVKRSTACVCVHCNANITSNQYIVCLAQEGSFQTYVNPSGVLHDIVTLSQVTPSSIRLIGVASEEYSWFPGYSWTIIDCSTCFHHLGWLFQATKSHLRPRLFWGIRRDAIISGTITAQNWHPCI